MKRTKAAAILAFIIGMMVVLQTAYRDVIARTVSRQRPSELSSGCFNTDDPPGATRQTRVQIALP